MDQNQIDLIRQSLFKNFLKSYEEVSLFIKNLEINPLIKSFATMNFDQGMFWVREGISSYQVTKNPDDKITKKTDTKKIDVKKLTQEIKKANQKVVE